MSEIDQIVYDFEMACGPEPSELQGLVIKSLRELHEADDESQFVIDKLSQLLAATAIALKGEPEALRSHSYHDIPELAATLKSVNDQLLAWQASMRSDIDYLAQALIDSESVITSGAKVIEELLDENGSDVGIERRVEDFKASLLNLGHWRTRDAFVNSAAARLNELLAWQASVMVEVGPEPDLNDYLAKWRTVRIVPSMQEAGARQEHSTDSIEWLRKSALNLAAKLKEAMARNENAIQVLKIVGADLEVLGLDTSDVEDAIAKLAVPPKPIESASPKSPVRYIVSYHEANTTCLMAGIDSGSVGMRAGWYLVSFDDRGRGAFYGDAHDTPEAALNSKPLECAACNTSGKQDRKFTGQGELERTGYIEPQPILEPIYMVPGDTSSPIVGHRSVPAKTEGGTK